MKTTGRTPRWTFGLVVRKKPVKFAALALVLTAVLAVCLDPVLTALVRGAGIRGDATAIAVAALAIFFVVAVLASGLLLTVLSNLRLARMTPEAAQALFDRQCRFFWSRLYSLALGYVVWCVSWYFAFQYATTRPRSSFLVNLAAFLIPILLAQLVFNPFNKLMIRITGTNRALIEDFQAGRYWTQLPASCRDVQSRRGILTVLENGEAGSIRGAVVWYQIKRAVYGVCRRLGRALLIVSIAFLILAVILGMTMSPSKLFDPDGRI